jgi:methanethiol S-methyltransferase
MQNTGFFWILFACALYGLAHSILASNTVKDRAGRLLGQSSYRRFYRLFFALAGFVTALPLFALVPLLPDQTLYRIPPPWLPFTLTIQSLAGLALLVGVLQTGALAFIGIRQLLEPANSHLSLAPEKLVVGGLYRWVRHPLYTASFIVLWLTPVMTMNLLALNLGLSLYMLIGTIFEEQKLVQQFGAAYIEYRRRTPRMIPGIKIT